MAGVTRGAIKTIEECIARGARTYERVEHLSDKLDAFMDRMEGYMEKSERLARSRSTIMTNITRRLAIVEETSHNVGTGRNYEFHEDVLSPQCRGPDMFSRRPPLGNGGGSPGPNVRMEMPRFNGENPCGWLCKVERYFRFYEYEEEQKFIIVSVYLDGPAASWFESVESTNQLHSLPQFKQLLLQRFGPSPYRDMRGDGGKLSSGFDINVFAEVHKTGDVSLLPEESVDLLVNTIEDANKPSVAAIQGLPLGGGLELTMCCHARISTPYAQLGLPELSLGVFPGFGGTQRLPRLVGLTKAIEMMLLSKSIRAKEGKEYGLVDGITSAENLMGSVTANMKGLMKKGSLTLGKKNKALSLLKGVLDYSDFKDVDMVIEAVIEKVQLKQSIFSELENICPRHCIMATNTSTIDLNVVGEKTKCQDRIVGVNFFSPAHVMPLLEIVRTEKTSQQVILDLMTVGKIIKKVPVVVGNCTGFAVNRTLFPYNQAAHLLMNYSTMSMSFYLLKMEQHQEVAETVGLAAPTAVDTGWQLPSFDLEGKVVSQGGSNVTPTSTTYNRRGRRAAT